MVIAIFNMFFWGSFLRGLGLSAFNSTEGNMFSFQGIVREVCHLKSEDPHGNQVRAVD